MMGNILVIDVGRGGIGGYDSTIPKIEHGLETELEKHYPNQFTKNDKMKP
jgi:hypothetical protein